MGDFDMTLRNPNLNELVKDNELCNVISESTCFKSINLTGTDNFLTYQKARFLETVIFETGLSDHHKLIGTMLRPKFAKEKPNKTFYHC